MIIDDYIKRGATGYSTKYLELNEEASLVARKLKKSFEKFYDDLYHFSSYLLTEETTELYDDFIKHIKFNCNYGGERPKE
ncbi:hypothetical protein FACS1894110_14010 [Spirochaetia bacterium]|nr:hypothetical protein FACS1894110_14010 [Spirochaetia bacterium]